MKNKVRGNKANSLTANLTITDIPRIQLRRGSLEVRAKVSESNAGRLMTLAMLEGSTIEEALSKFLNDSDHLNEWLDEMAKAYCDK